MIPGLVLSLLIHFSSMEKENSTILERDQGRERNNAREKKISVVKE
jgi:hypothetical protein